MKIILLENVRKVGSIGEVIDVKRGFARNFLISKKKALFASKENVQKVEKIKQDQLQNKEFEVKKLSTENKELYGSVKPTEIAKILKENEDIEVNPSLIQPLQEIKSIGSFKVILNLHSEIQSEISIKVITDDSIK